MSIGAARVLVLLGAFVAGLVLFGAVVFIVTGRSPAPVALTSTVGGPFSLTDQNAKPITDQDFKGHPFLVFFGFTHCPDVCPTTLFEVSEILRKLGPDADKVKALFVTVDPERDGPKEMGAYSKVFNSPIIGLTGSPAQIDQVKKQYGIYAEPVPHAAMGQEMTHTGTVLLFDRNGKLASTIASDDPDASALDKIKRVIG